MNCSPTLTVEEFKKVHNALCELRSIRGRLEDVVHPALFARLNQAVSDIEGGLEGAYEQDGNSFETKSTHYNTVAEELGLTTVWSIFEVDDLNSKYSFEGVEEVVYKAHWGPKPVHVQINGLTWAALFVAANAAIRDSGDNHHTFIEHFTQSGNQLILSTGS